MLEKIGNSRVNFSNIDIIKSSPKNDWIEACIMNREKFKYVEYKIDNKFKSRHELILLLRKYNIVPIGESYFINKTNIITYDFKAVVGSINSIDLFIYFSNAVPFEIRIKKNQKNEIEQNLI
jgi:hypothetical protein